MDGVMRNERCFSIHGNLRSGRWVVVFHHFTHGEDIEKGPEGIGAAPRATVRQVRLISSHTTNLF